MVYGFTAKSKRKNSAESGRTPVDCKWRSCNKCNAKHHICTSVKPPIRILADKEQDKSEKPVKSASDKSRTLHPAGITEVNGLRFQIVLDSETGN